MKYEQNLAQRQAIFRELVAMQDALRDVVRAGQLVRKAFKLTVAELRQIEDEGIGQDWPMPEVRS